MTEAIPQTMPNIVRNVRILWLRKVENAWRNISERVMRTGFGLLLSGFG
jgi:hypothetical protein